jgi:AcrR family transcriptional regulator
MARVQTRDRIVDAAMHIVRDQGPARLTLDEAARVANVSKGGVLYHFKSKDELLKEMVHRLLERCDALADTYYEQEPEGPYRLPRALVHAAFDPLGPGHDPVGAAVLAASALNPSLIEPVRGKFDDWHRRIVEEAPDPDKAFLVMMAMDGLFLNQVTKFKLYDQDLMIRLKAKALSILSDD